MLAFPGFVYNDFRMFSDLPPSLKTLLGISVVLFVFVLGAGGYLFFNDKFSGQGGGDPTNEIQEGELPPEGGDPKLRSATGFPVSGELATNSLQREKTDSLLSSLSGDTEFLANVYLQTAHLGEFVSLRENITGPDGVTYPLALTIKSKISSKEHTMYFTQEEVVLLSATVLEDDSFGTSAIYRVSLSDLVPGDEVVVTRLEDLLDPGLNNGLYSIQIRRGVARTQ